MGDDVEDGDDAVGVVVVVAGLNCCIPRGATEQDLKRMSNDKTGRGSSSSRGGMAARRCCPPRSCNSIYDLVMDPDNEKHSHGTPLHSLIPTVLPSLSF